MTSLAPERTELLHDWEQGNYIEGGVLEGRIDWDGLAEMELVAKTRMEKALDHYDSAVLNWSGGIDCLVLLHLLYQLDETDVPCWTFMTPEFYPSAVEFTLAFPERLGFGVETFVHEEPDIEWVKADPEKRRFMPWRRVDKLYDKQYRIPSSQQRESRGVDFAFVGTRNEHSTTDSLMVEKRGQLRCAPIYDWEIGHVIAYLDKYSLPIQPMYRHMTTGSFHPWYREELENMVYEPMRTVEECWLYVRQSVVPHGYTEFWEEHLCKHFPDAEAKAQLAASNQDVSLMELSDGYRHGANAQPVPYPVGPET